MSDSDSTSESLRKFLESGDPSLVLKGLSMAEAHRCLATLQSLSRGHAFLTNQSNSKSASSY